LGSETRIHYNFKALWYTGIRCILPFSDFTWDAKTTQFIQPRVFSSFLCLDIWGFQPLACKGKIRVAIAKSWIQNDCRVQFCCFLLYYDVKAVFSRIIYFYPFTQFKYTPVDTFIADDCFRWRKWNISSWPANASNPTRFSKPLKTGVSFHLFNFPNHYLLLLWMSLKMAGCVILNYHIGLFYFVRNCKQVISSIIEPKLPRSRGRGASMLHTRLLE